MDVYDGQHMDVYDGEHKYGMDVYVWRTGY